MSSFNVSASNPKSTVTVSTLAGGIDETSCGYKEGTGTGAKFASGSEAAQQLRRLSSGEIMVLDSKNCVIRLVSPITGTTTLLAGTSETYGIQDGPPNIGRFSSICAATEDYQGSVYILDQGYADIAAVGGRKFTLPCDATTHTLITCHARVHTHATTSSHSFRHRLNAHSPSATPYRPCDEISDDDPRHAGSPARRAAALAKLYVRDVCCSPATLCSLLPPTPMIFLSHTILCRLWLRQWRPCSRTASQAEKSHSRLSRRRTLYRE